MIRIGSLIFSGIWLVLLYFRLPHLIWHSGVLMAWFTDRGLIMYKDFLNFYFPLSTYFVLPFFKITDWNLETEPILSLAIALLTLILIFKTATRFLSPLGTSLSLFFFAALFYYFTTAVQYTGEAITGLFLILTANRILNFTKSGKKTTDIFIIGILISLTLLFNQISALSLITFSVFLLFGIFKTSEKKVFFNSFLVLTASITLPITLISLYFLNQNAFSDLFNNNFTYYLNYVKLARGSGILLSLPWNKILLFYTPAIIGIYLATSLKAIPTALRFTFLLLLLVSIATIPSIIFSVFHRHHFLYALPIISLLFGIVFDIVMRSKGLFGKVAVLLAGIFIVYQVFSTVFPWYSHRILAGRNNYIANDILPGDSMNDAVIWIEEHTKTEDKLLVAGDGFFYFKAGRLPASKFFTVLPWHYKPIGQVAPVILNNRPNYWVISPSYLERVSSPEGWNSPEITEFIRADLNGCYQLAITFPDWEIWQKSCL